MTSPHHPHRPHPAMTEGEQAMSETSESREVMLTVATDGEGKVWAENERGEVVGLAFVPQDDSSWDAVESVVQQARMFGERAR